MTTSAWFSCSRCGAPATSVTALLAHMREVHGAAPVTAEDETEPIAAVDAAPDTMRERSTRPPRTKTGRPPGTRALRLSPAERWVSVRDRYPDATLLQIASAESVSHGAVRKWRKAAVAAGLEDDCDLRSRAQRIMADRRPKRERLVKPARPAQEPKLRREQSAPAMGTPEATTMAPRQDFRAAALTAVEGMLAPAVPAPRPPVPEARPTTEPAAAPLVMAAPAAHLPSLAPRQVAITQALLDGRILLVHLDRKRVWWADSSIDLSRSDDDLAALSDLLLRRIVAPNSSGTEARVRRLVLTDAGRAVAEGLDKIARDDRADPPPSTRRSVKVG